MAKLVKEFKLFGMVDITVESEVAQLVGVRPKEGKDDIGMYYALSYKPKSAKKDTTLNVFKEDPYYGTARFASVLDWKKFIENKVAESGEDVRPTYEAHQQRAEAMQERTCYCVKFKVPDGYKYISKNDDDTPKMTKNFKLDKEGDLTSLVQVELPVEIEDFDYWVTDEPTEKSIAAMLYKIGSFVKK